MKREIRGGLLILFTVPALCLAGCGESKAAKEARLQGIEQMNAGNYADAVASFEKALDEADGIVSEFELDILKYRGEAEYKLEDYVAAAHTYQILIEVDGGNPECLYYKAASGARAGDIETALADYEAAAGMDQAMDREVAGAGLALTALGEAFGESGDSDRAMEFFQTAIDSGKGTAELYNQMGLCMMEAGRYSEAIESFDRGLALGDEAWTRELQYNKGAAYEYHGDFAGALQIFRDYVSAYGSTPELEKEIAFLESR